MRRSLSHSGLLERGRGICALAASAALIGGSMFGVAGASGHGDHGRGREAAPGFGTGQLLGQVSAGLARRGDGWQDNGVPGGGNQGSGDGSRRGDGDGRQGHGGGDTGAQPVAYKAPQPVPAPQPPVQHPTPAPASSYPAPTVAAAPSPPAHDDAPAWTGHGHGGPNQSSGRGDGGQPPWAGHGRSGHDGDQNSQGDNIQSSQSTPGWPVQISQRQNVPSGPTATPASTGSLSLTPATAIPAPAPAPAPAATPVSVPVPAPVPALTTTPVVVPVAPAPAPARNSATVPGFDSSTSLVGSLPALSSRTFSGSGALGLGARAGGFGSLFTGLGSTKLGAARLPAGNVALGLTGSATASTAPPAVPPVARHHASHSSAIPPYIEVVPNVIDHFVNVVPGVVWIALAASLGMALAGAGTAVAFRQKANRQAGRFAAVAAAALTDPLTGVLNRRGFSEAVERELARARRYGRTFVLAYVDVRGLKAVNDTEGHLAGDELLKGVAGLLSECARADDVVGRLGGDELGLLLAEQSPEAAGAVTQRIEVQVAERRAALGLSAPWSLTIGTAAYPADGETFDELIRTADRRLYEQRGIELR